MFRKQIGRFTIDQIGKSAFTAKFLAVANTLLKAFVDWVNRIWEKNLFCFILTCKLAVISFFSIWTCFNLVILKTDLERAISVFFLPDLKAILWQLDCHALCRFRRGSNCEGNFISIIFLNKCGMLEDGGWTHALRGFLNWHKLIVY